jgi:hypothetical protein
MMRAYSNCSASLDGFRAVFACAMTRRKPLAQAGFAQIEHYLQRFRTMIIPFSIDF